MIRAIVVLPISGWAQECPHERSWVDTNSANAEAVAVVGNYAYVGGSEGLFEIVDISSPAAPQHVGSIDTLSNPQAIKLANGLAYVADEYEGLKILDVSTPAAPTVVGSFDTIGKAKDVAIVNWNAFVAGDEGGFHIFSLFPCEGIFANGFESGTTDDWDLTAP